MTVSVTGVSIKSPTGSVIADATINGNSGTVSLNGLSDNTQIRSIVIEATSGSSMLLTSLSSANTGSINLNRTLPGLNLDAQSLLGSAVGDNQVGLGTLRTIFGSSVTINGTLSKAGYTSASVSLTVNLGTGGSPVQSQWAEMSINNSTRTITATIKHDQLTTQLVGMDLFNFINNTAGVIPARVGTNGTTWYNPSDSSDLALLKSAVGTLVGKTWNNAELADLVGKQLYFKQNASDADNEKYTIIFQ